MTKVLVAPANGGYWIGFSLITATVRVKRAGRKCCGTCVIVVWRHHLPLPVMVPLVCGPL